MSAIRFRQIARLEKLAQPYLEWKSGIETEWQYTLHGAVAHAAPCPLPSWWSVWLVLQKPTIHESEKK
jgi:hypothetical protein